MGLILAELSLALLSVIIGAVLWVVSILIGISIANEARGSGDVK